MILSHRHRFIFFAVPKTGTHSLRAALRLHLGDDDWEQCRLFVERRSPIDALAEKKHGHLSVRDVRPHLSDEIWRDYFKFAVVRNPWDRFISNAFFAHRHRKRFASDPKPGLRRMAEGSRLTERLLSRLQHSFLCDDDGRLAMDHVGCFETLQESFDEVCERIGIPRAKLDTTNRTSHEAYRTYYDDELKRLVGERYAQDAEAFGYDFDGPVK
jgi:hypothetical protein